MGHFLGGLCKAVKGAFAKVEIFAFAGFGIVRARFDLDAGDAGVKFLQLVQQIGQQHFEPSGRHRCANVDNQRALFDTGDAKMWMQVGGQQVFGGSVKLLPVACALQEVG